MNRMFLLYLGIIVNILAVILNGIAGGWHYLFVLINGFCVIYLMKIYFKYRKENEG